MTVTAFLKTEILEALRAISKAWNLYRLPTEVDLRPDRVLTGVRVFPTGPTTKLSLDHLIVAAEPAAEMKIERVMGGVVYFHNPFTDQLTPRPEPVTVDSLLTVDVPATTEVVLYLVS